MNEAEQLLNSLRDIQEPAAPEGVSILLIAANLLLLLVILAALIIRHRRKRESWRREALTIIRKTRKLEPQAGLLSLAKLLRQIVHHRHNHSSEHSGQAWLAQLDQEFRTQWFSQDNGRIFGETLYTRLTAESVNLELLCDRLSTLIKSLPAPLTPKGTDKS